MKKLWNRHGIAFLRKDICASDLLIAKHVHQRCSECVACVPGTFRVGSIYDRDILSKASVPGNF